jgi:hypothetical protein|tara:strand:+ start:74 stop:178 length:105 start_codon:yes stop_codon:yes gene_type:complete
VVAVVAEAQMQDQQLMVLLVVLVAVDNLEVLQDL